MSARLRRFLTPAKWLFALALLYFAFSTGRIDPATIKKFLASPQLALICVGLGCLWYGLGFWRWAILLRSQGLEMPMGEIFRICMASQFAQIFMPGTVGSDAFRSFYVIKRYPGSKARVLSTVFVDRLMGFFSLLLLANLGVLGSVGRGGTLGSIIFWCSLCSFLGLLGLLALPWAVKRLSVQRFQFLSRLPFQKALHHLKSIVLDFADGGAVLWKSLVLSMLSQTMCVLVLYTLAWGTFGPPPWGRIGSMDFLSASWLGSMIMGLPIAPMGLGVGQVAFAGVFKVFGAPSPSFGPSLVTNLQIVVLFMNFLGLFFFLKRRAGFEQSSADAERRPA